MKFIDIILKKSRNLDKNSFLFYDIKWKLIVYLIQLIMKFSKNAKLIGRVYKRNNDKQYIYFSYIYLLKLIVIYFYIRKHKNKRKRY